MVKCIIKYPSLISKERKIYIIFKSYFVYSLEYLNLNSNKIDRIRFPSLTPMDKTELFPTLRQLHISENHIPEVNVLLYYE